MSTNPHDQSAGATAGDSAGNVLKSGATKIHGLGEAIRGNINSFADSVTNTDSTRSSNVAARGVDEIETGKYQGTGAGVTPHDTRAERVQRDVQGEGNAFGGSTGSTTTGAGVGSASAGAGAGAGTTASGTDARLADGRFVK